MRSIVLFSLLSRSEWEEFVKIITARRGWILDEGVGPPLPPRTNLAGVSTSASHHACIHVEAREKGRVYCERQSFFQEQAFFNDTLISLSSQGHTHLFLLSLSPDDATTTSISLFLSSLPALKAATGKATNCTRRMEPPPGRKKSPQSSHLPRCRWLRSRSRRKKSLSSSSSSSLSLSFPRSVRCSAGRPPFSSSSSPSSCKSVFLLLMPPTHTILHWSGGPKGRRSLRRRPPFSLVATAAGAILSFSSGLSLSLSSSFLLPTTTTTHHFAIPPSRALSSGRSRKKQKETVSCPSSALTKAIATSRPECVKGTHAKTRKVPHTTDRGRVSHLVEPWQHQLGSDPDIQSISSQQQLADKSSLERCAAAKEGSRPLTTPPPPPVIRDLARNERTECVSAAAASVSVCAGAFVGRLDSPDVDVDGWTPPQPSNIAKGERERERACVCGHYYTEARLLA